MKNKVSLICQKIKSNYVYAWIQVLAIVANCIMISFEFSDQSDTSSFFTSNIVFTIIYTVDLVIGLLSVGIKNFYQKNLSNVFDTIIIWVGIIEILCSP